MSDVAGPDAVRERVVAICAGLPEATAEEAGRHVVFRVRGRTFAYLLEDHHGDGILGVVTKAGPGEGEALVAAHPGRFYRPAYLGHRGWVGLRLDAGPVNWGEVEDLVTDGFLLVAPKRVGAALAERGRPGE